MTVASDNFRHIVSPGSFVTMLTKATALIDALVAPFVTIRIFPAIVTIHNPLTIGAGHKIKIIEAIGTDGIIVTILVSGNTFVTFVTNGLTG